MKKFVNLPQNYKKLIEDIQNYLTKDMITSIANKTINYKNILIIYNNIDNLANKNNCNSYDLNKLIHAYDKKNIIIDILRSITSLRNKYIVYNAQKNKLWKKNLLNLKCQCKKLCNKNITIDNIEKGFIKIIKKYKYNWDGLWSVINIKSNGDIKKIHLFDIDDINELINYLEKIN